MNQRLNVAETFMIMENAATCIKLPRTKSSIHISSVAKSSLLITVMNQIARA